MWVSYRRTGSSTTCTTFVKRSLHREAITPDVAIPPTRKIKYHMQDLRQLEAAQEGDNSRCGYPVDAQDRVPHAWPSSSGISTWRQLLQMWLFYQRTGSSTTCSTFVKRNLHRETITPDVSILLTCKIKYHMHDLPQLDLHGEAITPDVAILSTRNIEYHMHDLRQTESPQGVNNSICGYPIDAQDRVPDASLASNRHFYTRRQRLQRWQLYRRTGSSIRCTARLIFIICVQSIAMYIYIYE